MEPPAARRAAPVLSSARRRLQLTRASHEHEHGHGCRLGLLLARSRSDRTRCPSWPCPVERRSGGGAAVCCEPGQDPARLRFEEARGGGVGGVRPLALRSCLPVSALGLEPSVKDASVGVGNRTNLNTGKASGDVPPSSHICFIPRICHIIVVEGPRKTNGFSPFPPDSHTPGDAAP